MFNDKLGSQSLERVGKKRPKKKRLTQKLANTVAVNSYSLDPMKRSTSGLFTISADGLYTDYSKENPENKILDNSNFSFGNVEIDSYRVFDEGKLSYKDKVDNPEKTKDSFVDTFYTKTELKNSKIDVLKRNTNITDFIINYPFPNENKSYAKCSAGPSIKGKNETTAMFSSSYENSDIKDSFYDESSNVENKDSFNISIKNNYNSGKIMPFSEKDNVKVNSIINSNSPGNKYYKNPEHFATFGFEYKSKKPDSIAFGGLKR